MFSPEEAIPAEAKARLQGQPDRVPIPPGSQLCGPGQLHDLSVPQLPHLETGNPGSTHFVVGGGMDELTHSECTEKGLAWAKPPGRSHHLSILLEQVILISGIYLKQIIILKS